MDNVGIAKIFNTLGFPTIRNACGFSVVEMDAKNAFIFSSIVGAKYLLYQNGITMKGRAEVFIHRGVFSNGYLIYSPGLFSRDINGNLIEGNSADVLKERFPTVFEGNKRILIFDVAEGVRSNIEGSVYQKIKDINEDPSNYVLYKNYLSNNIGESLQEYLATIYFSKLGYLTENQTPWFQQNYKYNNKVLQGGIPDFSAFHSNISNYLYKYGIIDKDQGIPVTLIPVIKNFGISKGKRDTINYNYELLIGEAKTGSSSLPQAIKQLEKYAAVNLANKLFTIIPDSSENNKFGSFYISNSTPSYKSGYSGEVDPKQQRIDNDWIDTYIKMLLLGNVKFSTIIDFISVFRSNNRLLQVRDYEATHLLDAVQNTSNEDFFNFFMEEICPTQAI